MAETRKQIILQYAKDCISGKIPSCEKHKWACMRAIRDFEKADSDPDYPYYWDEAGADSIVLWFTNLYHSKGELAKTPIYLTPWQQFHLCQVYGWKRKKDGRRRFKKMFIEVARKNAKSQELAGLVLYEISMTSTKNGELAETYTAGTKREQSQIVFKECKLMLDGSRLKAKFKITNNMIEHKKTGSFIKALSKDDGKNGDGTNPAVLVLDEYHQHQTTEFYDLSMGSNSKEPLLVIITTAGVDLNVPCYREYEFTSDILNPGKDTYDEEYMIDICEQDPEEEADPRLLMDTKRWLKSNPIRATYPEGIEKIMTTYQKALKCPEDMPACLTKNFDIWVQATESGYMDMSKWKLCEVSEFPVDIHGRQCCVGIDMSATTDLTSICFVIPYKSEDLDPEGEPVTKYILIHHSFIPNRDKMIERITKDKQPYDAWEKMGLITVTDAEVIDQKVVKLWVLDFAKRYSLDIVWWCFDPSNSSYLQTELSGEGEHVVQINQSYQMLNDPTHALREAVYEKRVMYQPDPLLNFAIGNAVIKKSNGLIKIDKDHAKKRIDPADALICAFKMASTIDQTIISKRQQDEANHAWLDYMDKYYS